MHSVHLIPRFSIIMVTCNAEKVLEDTIQSVVSQTYHHIERIIVDGTFRDETLSVINRYRLHVHTVIGEPDKGSCGAMDKGIALTSGDYLCSLNTDDCSHEGDTLQQVVHAIDGNKLPDIPYGETAIVDKDRYFLRVHRLSAPETPTQGSFKQRMLVCHQAFFPRHTLVEPCNLQYRSSADFDWCICIMKKVHTLRNTHLTIIDYLKEGMTTRNQKISLKEKFRIMVKHYGLIGAVARHVWFVIRAITYQ